MTGNKHIIAYFPNWGTYNVNHQNMTVGAIPWKKITMVYHAFFEIGADWKLKSTDDLADFQKPFEHSEPGWDVNVLKGNIGEYKYYKNLYPNKKLLLSIGGYTRSYNFPEMSQDPQKRSIFINSCIEFLKKYTFFNGLDIDWEYPRAFDKNNFTIFLKDLRQAYNNNGLSDRMITIAAPLGYQNIQYQDAANYIQYVDLVNIMAYDVYGAWDNLTNHHSPLYNNPLNPESNGPKFNIDSAVNIYLDLGVPEAKLCIGTPYYSRGWKNVDFTTAKGLNGLFAVANGAPVGTWDESWSPGGQWPWYQVKVLESDSKWEKNYDNVAKAPYLINRGEKYFLTYEDETSLKAKCDYIMSKKLAGIIIWEITGDKLANDEAPMTTILWNNLIEGQGGEIPELAPEPAVAKIDKPINQVKLPTNIPSPPILQLNNPRNQGIFDLNILLPPNNNATGLKIYENTIMLQDVSVQNKTTQQVYIAKFNDKATGTYSYKAALYNSNGASESEVVTVNVNNSQKPGNTNIPTIPLLSHNNWLNSPNYTITSDMWLGVNATSISLYENGQLVESKVVVDNTPNAQHVQWQIYNKANGAYNYYVEAENANGKIKSNVITVNVTKGTGGSIPKPLEAKIIVDNESNLGKYTLTGIFPANSSANQYILYENNSAISTGLLTPSKSAGDNIVVKEFTAKTEGIYSYRIDVTNGTDTVSSQSIQITVADSGTPPTQIDATIKFLVTSDWGSGANFQIIINNNGATNIDKWSFEFDFDKPISYVWDATMSVIGNHYTFTNPIWGGSMQAGSVFSFGGGCEGNIGTIVPRNIRLNGKDITLVKS